jgi:predicted nucleic acid-binding protein
VRFWDSSALVPLLVEEPRSPGFRRVLRADRKVAVWALTRVEIVSALRRKLRLGEMDAAAGRTALGRMEALAERWTEIDALTPVRDRAERLLSRRPLHAADALQLAAALLLVDDRPRLAPFVTADEGLAAAAEAEGFRVEGASRG